MTNPFWPTDRTGYHGLWKRYRDVYFVSALVRKTRELGGTVLLDAKTNIIHEDVIFDRANAGMVCDEEGNWRWEPVTRTNLIQDTNTSRNPNATTGLPDNWRWQTLVSFPGIQASVVGRGAIGALSYIDIKFAGTATSGDGWLNLGLASGGISVTPGAYKLSLYAQLISGTHGKPFGLATAGSGLTGGNYAIPSSQLETMTRVDADLTCTTAGAAYPNFGVNINAGDTLDFTIRLMQPQLEIGSYASAPIPTNGSPVTVPGPKYRRSYDVQTKEWGYLFEPQRTNLFTGWVANTNATVSATTDPQVFNVTFQPGGAIRSNSAADKGVDGVQSVFVKPDVATSFNLWTQQAVVAVAAPAGVWTRIVAPIIMGNSFWRIDLSCVEGGSVLIKLPQLETGSVATSPIATNGAAKTVAADACRVPNTALGLSDSGFTILARATHRRNESVVMSVQGSSTGRLIGRTGGGRHYMADTPAKVVSVGNPQLGTPYTTISSCSPVELTLRDSGSEGRVDAPPGYGLTSESIFNVGSNEVGADRMVGYINHLSVFPTQLNAEQRKDLVETEV